MQTWYDGGRWQTATIARCDRPFGLAPAIYSDQPGKMDIGWTDGSNKLWYMRWNANLWTAPIELNPSAMTPIGGSAPVNFGPSSPLVACARPANRRSQNTEYLVCDGKRNLWDLSFDGTTWKVANTGFSGLIHPPVQFKTGNKTAGPDPFYCLFWTGDDRSFGFARNNFAGEASATFVAGDFCWGADSVLRLIDHGTSALAAYVRGKNPPRNEAGLLAFLNGLLTDEEMLRHLTGVQTRFVTLVLLAQYNAHQQYLIDLQRWEDGPFPGPFDSLALPDSLKQPEPPAIEGEALRRLHRQLLEDAFPGTIARMAEHFGPIEAEPAVTLMEASDCLNLFWWAIWQGKWVLYDVRCLSGDWYVGLAWERGPHDPWPQRVAPAVVTSPDSRWRQIDVLWRNVNGDIKCTRQTGAGPGGWTTMQVASTSLLDSPPAGVVQDSDPMGVHVFWLGVDGRLRTVSSRGENGWTAPAVIAEAPLMSTPAPCWNFAPGGGLDLFYADTDASLKRMTGDGVRWNSEQTVAGNIAIPAVPAQLAPVADIRVGSIGEYSRLYCVDQSGAITLDRSAYGRGSVSDKIGDHSGSPMTLCAQIESGTEVLFWIDEAHKLRMLGVGTGSATLTLMPGAVDNGAGPNARHAFSSRFAPTPLYFPQNNGRPSSSSSNLFLCDLDMMLWRVAQPYIGSPPEFGSPEQLNLGPVAYAPVAAATVIPAGMQRGQPVARSDGGEAADAMVFWCAQEDKSLRQSWQDASGAWRTVTIDPGPMMTAPAILNLPQGELFVLWGAPDGTLRNTWAKAGDIRDPSQFQGWRTEVVANGIIRSAPVAIYDEDLEMPFVFWRTEDGVNQSWLNWGYDPGWLPGGDHRGIPLEGVPKWQSMKVDAAARPVIYKPQPKPKPKRPLGPWPSASWPYRIRPVTTPRANGSQIRQNLRSSQDGQSVDLWFSADQQWFFEPVAEGVYRIKCGAGIAGGRTYLSCGADGAKVDMWSADDGSGRQRWKLTLGGTSMADTWVTIEPSGGGRGYLSCNEDGSLVNLFGADDGSGRQRWRLTPA